ncbi:MAG: NAD(P)-binding domain-containing protein [Chloroflexi bacterium]|nr:NAD(P)-binding domain-containing protein [Chloroflexota bacterium]
MTTADYTTHYCIIGAGASGITAAKNLRALGISCTVFEREDDIGGNWYYGKPHSSVYQSTHLISSKTMTAYTDYPMPASYPDYPNHRQVLAYLRDYARHFGVYDLIEFNSTVTRAEREPDGNWLVTLDTGEIRRYGGLISAIGHLWDPKYPDIPGHFDGTTLHSAEYKTPAIFEGKHVLVIGAGNSGCDIAVDAASRAAQVFHSLRRGYHFIPKYIFGQPADVFGEYSLKLRIPRFIQRPIQTLLIRMILGNPARFGLPKPDHGLLQSHPLVNSSLLYAVGHGEITPKPDISKLEGHQVRFVDGSLERVDVIVYATGFKISFPFLDDRHLNSSAGKPRLFMHAFHPIYDNFFIIGMLEPDSGIFWVSDLQSQVVGEFIRAQNQQAKAADWFRQTKAGPVPDLQAGRRIDTDRHFLSVDHFRYKQLLLRFLKRFRQQGNRQ